MGASAAVPVNSMDEDHSGFQSLEEYALTGGYNIKTKNGVTGKALNTILCDVKARAYFLAFLQSAQNDAHRGLLCLMDLSAFTAGKTDENFHEKATKLFEEFIEPAEAENELTRSFQPPPHLIAELKHNLFDVKANESALNDDLRICLAELQTKIQSLLSLNHFPRFLRSRYYQQYLRDGIEGREELLGLEGADELGPKVDETLNPVDELEKSTMTLNRICELMTKDAVCSLLEEDQWLGPLFTTLDKFPVCICVSTASKSRPGFPIIYANKEFEKVTLYKNDDIQGLKCGFLQENVELSLLQQDQIKKVSLALKCAMPVRAVLTNRKKDGTIFKNLLSLKPLFDQDGVYRYVISAQYDVTSDCSTSQRLLVMQNVLDIIPDVMYYGEDNPFSTSKYLMAMMKTVDNSSSATLNT